MNLLHNVFKNTPAGGGVMLTGLNPRGHRQGEAQEAFDLPERQQQPVGESIAQVFGVRVQPCFWINFAASIQSRTEEFGRLLEQHELRRFD